ncbi:hypothetical protein THTE_4186 [Thermogutta terrifontis]|uniref:Uncharacterized protein n=1 Tax=Thermogutta terrifontis TaxID=1331910 RepID=A0A286RLK8_9BACT|nr:hypothetical protein [Thermogutta terrifontis]ASV76787.1 hypothetical protein THTE_4186 [Thermogutta terrifontis]
MDYPARESGRDEHVLRKRTWQAGGSGMNLTPTRTGVDVRSPSAGKYGDEAGVTRHRHVATGAVYFVFPAYF